MPYRVSINDSKHELPGTFARAVSMRGTRRDPVMSLLGRLWRLAKCGYTRRVLRGRMASCTPVGNRRWAAICKRRQAGYQPAAGCQPAPQAGTFRHCVLRISIGGAGASPSISLWDPGGRRSRGSLFDTQQICCLGRRGQKRPCGFYLSSSDESLTPRSGATRTHDRFHTAYAVG